METRTIQQVKVYCLVMNPVTDRAESGRIVIMSFEKPKLIERYNNEYTGTYLEDGYSKSFKKNGPLEWYNPIWSFDELDSFGHGLREEWIDSTNVDYVKGKYYFI